MATYLYRIGKFAYRRKGTVLSLWLAILVLFGVGAATLSGPTTDSFSIPGTPAQQTQDLLAERFPNAADPTNALSARYVFAAPDGQTLDEPDNLAAMNEVLAAIRGIDKVTAAAKIDPAVATPEQQAAVLVDPVTANAGLVEQTKAAAEQQGKPEETALADAAALSPLSPDRTVGFVTVPFEGGFGDVDDTMREQIAAAAEIGRDAGLNVQVSGTAAAEAEMPGGVTELIGIGIAAVVLAITFGSLVAAGLPLITAIIGIAIGSLGITVATGFADLSSMTPTLAIMIGLAVAIDYSLFIVSRFRHEITVTADRAEAAGRAVGTAGSAVVFAGLTVIIALMALSVVGIPFLSAMGYAAAFTVFIAVLIAITLLPAILGLFGRKAFAGRIPGLKDHDPEADTDTPSAAQRYIRWSTGKPLIPLVAGVLLLGLLALPGANLQLALPTEATGDPKTSARQAYDLVNEGFGPGRNGPLLVVADAREATVAPQEAFGAVVQRLYEQDEVVNAQVVAVDQAGDTAQIMVTPRSGPSEPATMDLVSSIRDQEAQLDDEIGVSYGVTGQTALEGDVSETLQSALVPYLAVVVGLAFILLMLVFRSILVPLTATLGFLLSVLATFGATVAVFQEGWGGLVSNPQPIVSFMPIFLIGVVFGLAMDYQVFLVTRMREEFVHGASAKEAVRIGFAHGARVVTAAAVIMISVFAAFIAEPNSFIKSIGFALAAAVFFDAFVVRMVIIPAVMALLGDKAWWLPKWLDRILPNVDVEGEKLRRELTAPEPTREPAHT
ncbi:MMPL family transporter [Rhodococcus sp. CSLK01-03]|uniref:MMPL family transporter n=1 Tax=Rhodococcus indonesiensis TaxID=3055869 RepID=A0ABT7RSR6_9NOCA|nr:MMPL family transporter [Rhodococcus indonesiensis]MDM7490668.1 MMPL family transporter [Rhodococcus indonesiensis]